MILFICLITIFISILILIYSCPKNCNAVFLALYLLFLSTYGLTHHFATDNNSIIELAVTYNHFSPFWVLIGPMIYFYVRGTLSDNNKWRQNDWIHFIPFILFLINVTPYFFVPFKEKIELVTQIQKNLNQLRDLKVNLIFGPKFSFLFRSIQLLGYQIAGIIILYQYEKMDVSINVSSNQKKIVTRWLWILLGVSVLLSLSFFSAVAPFLVGSDSPIRVSNHPYLFIAGLSLLLIGTSLLFFPQILYGVPIYKGATDSSFNKKIELANNFEKEKLVDKDDPFIILGEKIITYMKDQKPYLNEEFSVHDLAIAMNVPDHHISYCCHSILNQKFTTLKNKFRIEYAKELLRSGATKELTLDAISKQAGFQTRSNFYFVFKNEVGVSPLEFLEQTELN